MGILLLAISLISLLIFLEEGERRDWFYSNFIFISFSIFILCLIFFIKRELTITNPVIDLNIPLSITSLFEYSLIKTSIFKYSLINNLNIQIFLN